MAKHEKSRLNNPEDPSTLPKAVPIYLDAESTVQGQSPRRIMKVTIEHAHHMVRSPSWIVHAWSYTATFEKGTP